jgi:hypothetical protein
MSKALCHHLLLEVLLRDAVQLHCMALAAFRGHNEHHSFPRTNVFFCGPDIISVVEGCEAGLSKAIRFVYRLMVECVFLESIFFICQHSKKQDDLGQLFLPSEAMRTSFG